MQGRAPDNKLDLKKVVTALRPEQLVMKRTAANEDDVLQRWLSANKMYNWEGDSGLKNLEKLCQALGYSRSGFQFGDPIHAFLSDNSGAVEKILEFIEEWVDRSSEWQEALASELEDEPEDEEEPPDRNGPEFPGGEFPPGGHVTIG